MKFIVIGSTALFAFAMPAVASEFDFRGAEIVGTGYFVQPDSFPGPIPPFPVGVDDNFITASLTGSAEFGLGYSGLFVQGDAVFQAYDMGWDNFKLGSVGAHLGHEVGDDAAVGVFSYAELWDQNGDGDMSLGLEIAGQRNNLFFEGYGAYLFDPLNGSGWSQTHFEATGGYAFDSGLALEAGLHYTDGDMRFGLDGNAFQALANVSYRLGPEFKVEAGYVYTDFQTVMWDSWKSHSIKLALTREIGGGTTFSQRNYLNLHNGY